MQSFTDIEEINSLIYLYTDTQTFAKLGLLNKYNHNLLNKLNNDKNFFQQKLSIRLGLIGDDTTDYRFTLKFFDNDKSLEENCSGIFPNNQQLTNTIILFKNNNLKFNELMNEGRFIKTRKLLPTNKYSSEYWRCVTNKIIENVEQPHEDTIIITFKNSDLKLKLIAEIGCCDVSWFECNNINEIVGKEIKYIYDSYYMVDLPPSNRQECDSNHLIIIQFIDDSEYQFYLRNSSNGYYDGNLYISIINDNSVVSKNTQTFCNYQDYIMNL